MPRPPEGYDLGALAGEFLDSGGVFTQKAREIVRWHVDNGYTAAMELVLQQVEITRIIEEWLQSGRAKRWK